MVSMKFLRKIVEGVGSVYKPEDYEPCKNIVLFMLKERLETDRKGGKMFSAHPFGYKGHGIETELPCVIYFYNNTWHCRKYTGALPYSWISKRNKPPKNA